MRGRGLNMNWYQGKKVFITGGSSGIGKAAALLLVKQGAYVCIGARDSVKLQQTLQELLPYAQHHGTAVAAVTIDVANRAAVFAAAAEVIKKLGGIDILINSAGITWPGYMHTIPDDVWDSMMNTDYMGTVTTVRAFLPYFMQQKHGSIANVASVVGYMGVFGYAAYGAAKFAVVGFSECLRQEMLPYNVGVSVLYPPDTDTPQWHEENKIKPDETRALAGAIKVMSAEKVAASLIAGISKGSFTILPGFMNKVTYTLNRHLPWLVWKIVSGDLKKFWKNHPPLFPHA
jgi:3-dehydrosphinganine reductase